MTKTTHSKGIAAATCDNSELRALHFDIRWGMDFLAAGDHAEIYIEDEKKPDFEHCFKRVNGVVYYSRLHNGERLSKNEFDGWVPLGPPRPDGVFEISYTVANGPEKWQSELYELFEDYEGLIWMLWDSLASLQLNYPNFISAYFKAARRALARPGQACKIWCNQAARNANVLITDRIKGEAVVSFDMPNGANYLRVVDWSRRDRRIYGSIKRPLVAMCNIFLRNITKNLNKSWRALQENSPWRRNPETGRDYIASAKVLIGRGVQRRFKDDHDPIGFDDEKIRFKTHLFRKVAGQVFYAQRIDGVLQKLDGDPMRDSGGIWIELDPANGHGKYYR